MNGCVILEDKQHSFKVQGKKKNASTGMVETQLSELTFAIKYNTKKYY